MDLIQIATAGSVDDGKSTLIGNLLFETNSLKEDQLQHMQEKSHAKGLSFLDYSLATDGLLTEREQGITIDVSHIFMTTPKRRYIIADAPGHAEYTRNMVTGVSNAQAVILLIDARKGIVDQTRRHYNITKLLGIKHIIFAINKMDLIAYDAKQFNQIKKNILNELVGNSNHLEGLHFIPLAAIRGENVVHDSKNMKWFSGSTLLSILEDLPQENNTNTESLIQIQYVLRPQKKEFHDYRGYAGKIKTGTFKIGDLIDIFPSGNKTSIKSIEKYGFPVQEATKDESVTLLLADEVDASRESIFYIKNKNVQSMIECTATVCWMQAKELSVENKFWVQIGIFRVQAKVNQIHSKIALIDGASKKTDHLKMNDIGEISLQFAKPILGSSFITNKALGSFIMIDSQTNNTAGAGFIK